jgi:hypothetical protein
LVVVVVGAGAAVAAAVNILFDITIAYTDKPL